MPLLWFDPARLFKHRLTFASAQYQSTGTGYRISSHIGTVEARSASGWSRASRRTASARRQFVAAKSAPAGARGADCAPANTTAAFARRRHGERRQDDANRLQKAQRYPTVGYDAAISIRVGRESSRITSPSFGLQLWRSRCFSFGRCVAVHFVSRLCPLVALTFCFETSSCYGTRRRHYTMSEVPVALLSEDAVTVVRQVILPTDIQILITLLSFSVCPNVSIVKSCETL